MVNFFSGCEGTSPFSQIMPFKRQSSALPCLLHQIHSWIICIQTAFLHVGTSNPESSQRRKALQQRLTSGWACIFLVPFSLFHLRKHPPPRDSIIEHSGFWDSVRLDLHSLFSQSSASWELWAQMIWDANLTLSLLSFRKLQGHGQEPSQRHRICGVASFHRSQAKTYLNGPA